MQYKLLQPISPTTIDTDEQTNSKRVYSTYKVKALFAVYLARLNNSNEYSVGL